MIDLGVRARMRLGTTIKDKYRIDSVLGVGGMAVVYKATHRNQAEFAIKMLRSELSEDAEIRTRFLREGYAANSVKHPGVVTVVDDDVAEDGTAFLVMELLDGVSLEDVSQRFGPLPPIVACSIGVQLLDILAAAHAKGILHRDIKPANLFLTRAGQVKLLDFGIARVHDAVGDHRVTATGMAFGTPAYMAPEQARGNTRELDDKCDVWQAGATIYTLVTGKLVHEGENAHQILVRAATRPAPSIGAALPPDLAAPVDRALAFEKDDRPTAAELRDTLARITESSLGERPSHDVLVRYVAQVPPRVIEISGSETRRPEDDTARDRTGATTASPVTSDKTRAARSRLAIVIGIVAAFAIMTVAILVVSQLREPAKTSVPAAPPPTTSGVPVAVVTASEPIPTVLGPTTIMPSASASVAPRTTTTTTIRRPAPSAKPDCNPNFWVDAQNNKHFKPECFK